MNLIRRQVCALVSFALCAAPVGVSHAQGAGQPFSHSACVNYSAVPPGATVAFRFAGEAEWRPGTDATRHLLLVGSSAQAVQVLIWKQIPRNSAERSPDNTRQYSITLAPTSSPDTCFATSAGFHVRYGEDGYTLYSGVVPGLTYGSGTNSSGNSSGSSGSSSRDEAGRKDGLSTGAVVAGVLGLMVLAAILGRGSSSGSSGSGSSSNDDQAWVRQQDMERARREAAERAAERAEQERRNAAAEERLQRPNGLGW